MAVAYDQLTRPANTNPYAAILQKHGEDHERRYVTSLAASGRTVVDLKDVGDASRRTQQAMRGGADVIVQARLESDSLVGYADLLLRVDSPSDLGDWSYEVQDTKLAKETKGGTILQLTAYSNLVGAIQGRNPSQFHVVTPADASSTGETGGVSVIAYRVEDYAAYYRMILESLRAELGKGYADLIDDHYPEPVEACSVCVWESRCEARRRTDDHLSFVAGAGRSQRVELASHGYTTLAAAATMPVPVTFRPARGARETYDRLGHQARVQHLQRTERRPIVERLPVRTGEGLSRLPPPSPGDVFLDLEGARFARDGGREFLFGIWSNGRYRAWWAVNDQEERAAFEAVVDLLAATWQADDGMHVYHFNHYEPTAFKKLMGRYVTRGDQLDRLLRAERFVDLYPVARQAIRAGVESYSIKQLEQYSGYTRTIALSAVGEPMLAIELALDVNAPDAITDEIRATVQGYNEDDCRSAKALRDWLESLRTQWENEGSPVPRPTQKTAEPNADVAELHQRAEALRGRLLETIPPQAAVPTHVDHPRWLLAYLIDWHRRETNAEWWEYYRLRDLPEEDLFDERDAVAGLTFVERVEIVRRTTGSPTGSVIDRYSYPAQDIEIGRGDKLRMQDETRFGEVINHDRANRLLDIKKGKAMVDAHPSALFSADIVPTDVQQESVMRLAQSLMETDTCEPYECGIELLFRRPPRLRSGSFQSHVNELAPEFAVRLATMLDRTSLAIQGPPGSGKTHIGAQMVLALVRAGFRVGVTANSHKVVRNLLEQVVDQACRAEQTVRVGAKVQEIQDLDGSIQEFDNNEAALEAIGGGELDVLGGTTFLWARQEFARTVDVLFIDEAGQMSLANALAVSQAGASMVLLGDPQQLDQPQKASHPDGVAFSALEHVLGRHETMPDDCGMFLPTTWRMSPTLCRFTSEMFYEGKLSSSAGLERQELRGTGTFDGSYLWLIPVEHDGNQSSSIEEVEAVRSLVDALLTPGSAWIDENGEERRLTAGDLRIVAPFNAQVNRLTERLADLGAPIGTVDKFQGQTAAVVIYSMATSQPEDAPRGMEFLYSLNRLNVATSRARCAVFVVASPHLFEPECRTPRQIHLANALCRYRELARTVTVMPAQSSLD